MKTLCQITAQYYENYSDSETPHWKPKGGQQFDVMVDADDFMYASDTCIEVIQDLLAKQSDSHGKYEYLSYELIFFRPIVLDEKEFEDNLAKKYESNRTSLVDENGRETMLGKIVEEGDYELDEF